MGGIPGEIPPYWVNPPRWRVVWILNFFARCCKNSSFSQCFCKVFAKFFFRRSLAKHIDFAAFCTFSQFLQSCYNPCFFKSCKRFQFQSIWLVLMAWHLSISNSKFPMRRLWCLFCQMTRVLWKALETSSNLWEVYVATISAYHITCVIIAKM